MKLTINQQTFSLCSNRYLSVENIRKLFFNGFIFLIVARSSAERAGRRGGLGGERIIFLKEQNI